MIVWIDTETTGVNYKKDVLLEVAVVITDDELNVITGMSRLIDVKPRKLKNLNPFVQDMHERSGLLKALENESSTVSLKNAEEDFIKFLKNNAVPERAVMAGNSIHFDRTFLDKFMPEFSKLFGHQNLDVTSIGHCVKRWHPAVYDLMKRKRGTVAHRALDDVLSSIDQLKAYRHYSFSAEPNLYLEASGH